MENDVERLLEMQQTGEYIPTEEEKQNQEAIISPGSRRRQLIQLNPELESREEVRGMEAALAGYGQSRYDTGEFSPEADLENKRAIDQSGFWKIANGAVKGGIYAGTTAVETVAGVIDGLLEGTYELSRQIAEGEGVDVQNVIGRGVNNFTARTMKNIQQLSDEWFPNYRTIEERSPEYQEEWLKHIFTANFIGDSFLKNFGFTVGALAGGAVWSKALSAALRAGAAGNLMKGVTAAAEGNTEAANVLGTTLEMVNSGAAQTVDATQVAKNLSSAAKGLNRMKAEQALFGSVIAAMGEGTMEGVMARDEFLDNYLTNLNREYADSVAALENHLIKELESEGGVQFVPETIGEKTVWKLQLNNKGRARLEEEKKRLAEDYIEKRRFAEDQADKIAATTFLLNLPILTASNTIQFGKMFSGGFKTARNAAKVAGGISKNAEKIAADYAVTGGNTAARAALGSLKVGTSEATEEMLQGVVSSGAKNVADARITAFNDDAYDPEVLNSLRAWYSQMAEGGKEYLSDWKNWQEGFLGMVTGLIGMPGKTWSGGVPGAIREAKEETRNSAEAAAALNNRINTDKFQNAWKGYVRHMKYENEMEDAIRNDDQYSWTTANDKQLINDVMLFANAGRLQDLKDLVDTYATLTDAEAEELGIPDAVTSNENEKRVRNNPQEAIAKVREQAENIKKSIDLYTDMYDAMSARAPYGTSQAQLEELIATGMNIRAFENRFLTMFDEVIKGVEKYVKPLSIANKFGEELTNPEEQLQRAKEIYSSLTEIYTGTGIPIDTPILDALGTISTIEALEKSIKDSGDTELAQKFEDMKKVAANRKEFLRKMLTLQNLPPAKYDAEAQTPEKVVDQQKKERAEQETQGLDSMVAVRQAYLQKNAEEKAAFLEDISTIEDSNPNVKSFLELKRKIDGFRAYLDKNGFNTDDVTVNPQMINSAVNDLIRRANSVDDFTTMPDSMFSSLDEFIRDNTGIFGAPSAATFESVKTGIRQAMANYLGLDAQTASKDKLNPTPVKQKPEPGTVSKPTGYDAAQPGSVEPAPTKENPAPHVPPKAQPEPEIPVHTETAKPAELADESIDSYIDEMPQEVIDEKIGSSDEKPKIPYYRTSIPEIATKSAKDARTAIRRGDREALKQVDLSDFSQTEPKYADLWNALNDRGAFTAIATQVKPGDEIEFVIDPAFPTYDGKYQILMTTVKDGNRQVLTILSSQTSQYYHLRELRQAIDGEYSSWSEQHPNEPFVFSQKSKVWAKRPGLIDYDYSRQGEKGIRDIPGYNENAPLVFIDRNGEAIVIRGDKKAAQQVSSNFNNPDKNKGDVDGIDRRGNLYYLTEVNNSSRSVYVPIRLGVEHFKEETRNLDIPMFQQIRDELGKISTIISESNNNNFIEQNEKLRKELPSLTDLLDLSGVYFEIGNYNNIGVALKIVPNYTGTNVDEENTRFRRPDQMSENWLIDYIAGLDRSIQVKLNDGKLVHLNEMIDQGILTSNAKMLRQKGADFYINPWTIHKDFAPVTAAEQEAERLLGQTKPLAPITEPEPIDPGSDSFGSNEFFDFENLEVVTPIPPNQLSPEAENVLSRGTSEDPVFNMVYKKFAELPKNIQDGLTAKGWSEEEFNKAEPLMKDKVLRCL